MFYYEIPLTLITTRFIFSINGLYILYNDYIIYRCLLGRIFTIVLSNWVTTEITFFIFD